MTDRILNSWKEIADYVKQNIRTCQRWEKNLGFPVHRLEGYANSRVFATKEEIDRWMKKRLAINKKLSKTNFQASKKRILVSLTSIFLLFSTSAFLIIIFFKNPSQPTDFLINGSTLNILDEKDQKLGEFDTHRKDLQSDLFYRKYFQNKRPELRTPFPMLAFEDIDNNGSKEILFIIKEKLDVTENIFVCLSRKVKKLWEYRAGREVVNEKNQFNHIFKIRGFGLKDFNGDLIKEIVLIKNHISAPLSWAIILNSKGEIIREYKHSGKFNDFMVLDLNDDGIKEIILAGYNSDNRCPCCVILECTFRKGGLPHGDEENTGKNKQNFPLIYCIDFPTNDLMNELPVNSFTLTQISTSESNSEIKKIIFKSNIITFYFNFNLMLVDIEFQHRIYLEFNEYIEDGKITKTPNEIKKQMFYEGAWYYNKKHRTKIPPQIKYIQN
jgi:hypothetical protein